MKQPSRSVVRLLILFLTLVLCGWGPVLSLAVAEAVKTESIEQKIDQLGKFDSFAVNGDIRRFAGETLFYDVDFMIFSKAAEAQISFYEENGGNREEFI